MFFPVFGFLERQRCYFNDAPCREKRLTQLKSSPPDREPAINGALHVTRRFFGVMPSKKGVGHILLFASHRTRQLPDSSFVKVAIACALASNFVCAMCAPRDQMRYKRLQFWLVWSAHKGVCSSSSPLIV